MYDVWQLAISLPGLFRATAFIVSPDEQSHVYSQAWHLGGGPVKQVQQSPASCAWAGSINPPVLIWFATFFVTPGSKKKKCLEHHLTRLHNMGRPKAVHFSPGGRSPQSDSKFFYLQHENCTVEP